MKTFLASLAVSAFLVLPFAAFAGAPDETGTGSPRTDSMSLMAAPDETGTGTPTADAGDETGTGLLGYFLALFE